MKPQVRLLSVAIFSLCTSAAGQSPGVTITVLLDRYAIGNRAFDNLDALEREVNAARPSAITLVACSSSAGPGVMAAGHRFRSLPIQIVPKHYEEMPCSRPLLAPAGMRDGRRATGAEVQRYWESIAP